MNIKYSIKDDFLDQVDFANIKNIMLGHELPWFFQHEVAFPKKNEIKDIVHGDEFFWGHVFFRPNQGISSPFFKILAPILKKLKPKALIRIRANLFSNQGKIIEHENHSDCPFKHKGALFSLNTCNGFTVLKDNTKIKSVENRMLLFDPSLPHRSSTCTDAKVRCNININYF